MTTAAARQSEPFRADEPDAVSPTSQGSTRRAHNDFGSRPSGALNVVSVGEHWFETGGYLPSVDVAYETWGSLNAAGDNAILIAHALTGDSHVAATAEDPSPGWWENVIGADKLIDPQRWFVIAPAMVGGCYGSTGPASLDPEGRPWGSRFPFVTIRDSVHVEKKLLDQLGVRSLHSVIGGSMGGARALEWPLCYPDFVESVAVLACSAASTAEQVAFAQAQILAIEQDPHFNDGDYYDGPVPVGGLGLARRIAHITYRAEAELQIRFGRKHQGAEDPFGAATLQRSQTTRRGRYQVESYLDHHGAKLISRFDPNAYITLSEALISHDVGRNRGGVATALGSLRARAFIACVDTDRLYLPEQAQYLAELIPTADHAHQIHSPIGHDGFLTSPEQLGVALRDALSL